MIHISDLINGLFELGGGLLIWLNVKRILKDKMVRGTNWNISGFFWAWGIWNIWYYPSLNQWLSFAGGLLIVLANTVWLALAIKYRKN
jgi:hypothetical protein